MTLVAKFTFNPFEENTYVVYDDSGECVIFDPGCFTAAEKKLLADFISANELTPVRLINTHCHLDHVFGNKFVAEQYGLGLEIHEGELPVLKAVPQVCAMYGLPLPEASPMPTGFLEGGTTLSFGNTEMAILFTPGHSPASLSFFCKEGNFVIAGDVLFRESIGRTDLPGGNFQTLIQSIKTQFYPLGDEVLVYSGHGEETTVGYEREHNLFLNGVYGE
jgi:hydroxyacylglutathione hydrolase